MENNEQPMTPQTAPVVKPQLPIIEIPVIEAMVNARAKELAKKLKLTEKEKFQIFLPLGNESAAIMERGTTVNIYITGYSIIQPEFWRLVKDCLRLVPRMIERTDLMPASKVYRKIQNGKWTSVAFKDKSEILPVLHKDRVTFKITTTVTAIDKVSGLQYSVTSDNSKIIQMENAALCELSREVWTWEQDAEIEDESNG